MPGRATRRPGPSPTSRALRPTRSASSHATVKAPTENHAKRFEALKSAFQPKRLLATAPGGFSDFIPSVAVIDLLEIPETIEPGEYVLQYRYDSEQTPQVWNTCSGERRPCPQCAAKFQRVVFCCRHQDPSEGAGPAPDQQVGPDAAAVASAPARQARFVPAGRKGARRSAVPPCLPLPPSNGMSLCIRWAGLNEHVRGTDKLHRQPREPLGAPLPLTGPATTPASPAASSRSTAVPSACAHSAQTCKRALAALPTLAISIFLLHLAPQSLSFFSICLFSSERQTLPTSPLGF